MTTNKYKPLIEREIQGLKITLFSKFLFLIIFFVLQVISTKVIYARVFAFLILLIFIPSI
ncbi:MAG: hypothetical protein A2086_15980 [Spirochaetes bacterium GWD1_27_9]|nr:MAG: hypothetical protein A2Z98_11405 [Spirochaetes bacterium GWB1_27_13]OHD25116.1 MAG: hypothetical protein A2Y34_12315 [Spirochaetes bacterium GWC1_27_15]OHD36214.1 MAG: hypothetical protein A2086_15980 [Spirochaetes bacterium GWD1_27_9]